MAVSASDITKLYLAYFGRPPDFDGMVYYTTQSSLTLQQIAANFSNSPESQALYGASSLSGVIDSIYMNLFNRHAEPGGLLYWSQQIASGAITPAFAAYAILIGAQNQDAVTVANKLQVSTDWLAHLDTSAEITGYAGADAAQSARTFLATVDNTTASVQNAETNLDNAIAAAVNASQPGPLDVAISSPSIVEGNTGTKELAFVVTLSHASATPVTVSYTTGGGTATAGDDYQATAGSITFQPGQTTAVVNVTVFGDITVENDETVGLTVTGTTIGNSGVSAMGTIVNDDVNPVLTTGIDTIDVVGTGVNTIKGIVDGTTASNSTFSNGDTINGNGQTILQLLVSAGGTGAIAFVNGVSEVDVVAGAVAAISFNAIEWTGVGSVNLSGGVSGATLTIDSLADTVSLGIGATVGGEVVANYQGGLHATLANTGKGGASYDATSHNVTVHLNTDGALGGAHFSSSHDVTVGDVVIDGGAKSALAGLNVTGAHNITVGAVGQDVGVSASDVVSITSTNKGDIVVGGIAQIAGTSGFAKIAVNGSGDIALGDLSQQVGSGSSASATLSVHETGKGVVTVGNITQGAGHLVSASVSTTGSGDITVGNVVQGASTSDATLYVKTTVGSIAVGDVSQNVGDSATATVELSVTSAAGGVAAVAGISVGAISQIGGKNAEDHVHLVGATGTTATGAPIGGDVHVGGLSQQVGKSGSMHFTVTAADSGSITVGNVSQVGGDSATGHVHLKDSGDITVGNVTITMGNGSDINAAHLQVEGSGDITVGNIDMSAGSGETLNVWATLTNTNGHDLTIGNVSMAVGDLTNTTGTRPKAYFGAFNDNATGNMTVGDVAMHLGVTATGLLTISQTNAASSDGGSLSVGNIDLTLADKAHVGHAIIQNTATVFTSVSHTTANTLGALTVGDVNLAMGTNAVASVTISQIMNGTNGGDVGAVTVGNIDIMSAVNGYASVSIDVANNAGGNVAGVDVGNVSFNMDDGGSFTFELNVADVGGSIDHVTVGNVGITLGVSGTVNNFTIDAKGGSVGDVKVGDMSLNLGQHASADTLTVSASASTGDIGSVTVGNISEVIGQSATADGVYVHATATAGNIGSVTVGDVTTTLGKNAEMHGNWVSVTAAKDIGTVTVGDVSVTLGQAASFTGTGMYVGVFATGGDVGTVSVGNATINVGKTGHMGHADYVTVTGQNVNHVTVGDLSIALAAGATVGTESVKVLATTGDIGTVSIGNLSYKVNGGTAGVVNETVKAAGAVDSATFGNADLTGAVKAVYHVTAGTGDIGTVQFGNLVATSAAKITADVKAGLNNIGSVTFAGLGATSATVVANITGANVGDVHLGHLVANEASANTTAMAQVAAHITTTGTLGNITIGNVDVSVVSGSALLSVTVNAGTASGDVTVGDISMGVATTTTTAAPAGGFGEFQLNFTGASLTGALSVGNITFNGLVGNVLDVELGTGVAGDVHIAGIDVKGTGTFTGGAYVLHAHGANVTIDTVKIEGSTVGNSLATVLGGVTHTGTLKLGTVDYSTATGAGTAINVSAYGGNIHVIGSAGNDTITSNTGSDTLTGGNGTDQFVITTQSQNATTLANFHAMKVETITDFKAGPSSAETIQVDAQHTDVAHYAEKTASSVDAAFTTALATMSDPTLQSDVVAVQVAGDTYVFVDTAGANHVDQVIHLVGVSLNDLNFADFVVV